jgi:ribonucleotide reductase alpha subunit
MINTYFGELIRINGTVNLFSIKDVPDLYKAFYSKDSKEFVSLYEKYSKNHSFIKGSLLAREIAKLYGGEQFETGRLYDLNIERANQHTSYKEPIETSNLCVAPETLILTDNGQKHISDLVDQEVNVWNGEIFSKVVVKKTGINVPLLFVKTADKYGGNIKTLKCTPEHKWYLQDGSEVRTSDLTENTHLLEWYSPNNELQKDIVISVQKISSNDTYCLTEPLRHMAVFNGILTGQCNEIVQPTATFHSARELYETYSSEYIYVNTVEENQIVIKDYDKKIFDVKLDDFKLPKELKQNDKFIYNSKEYTVIDLVRKNEISLCNIAAVNLFGDYTDEEYEETCYYALYTILWVINNSEYPFPNLEYTAKARRNAGVGLIGLAYELARNNKFYSSKSGKEHTAFIAERHGYMLLKASVRLAKEYGVPDWYERTTYSDGWLPIHTINPNIKDVINLKFHYDWDELDREIKTHGLAFSSHGSIMPAESSAQVQDNVNSVYPPRQLVVIKGDGSDKNITIVPEYDTLKYNYEIAWDIPTKDLIDHYAILQSFIDGGISADYYRDFSNPDSPALTDREIFTNILYKLKMGTKGTYYSNSKTRVNKEPETPNSSCGSGGCQV